MVIGDKLHNQLGVCAVSRTIGVWPAHGLLQVGNSGSLAP